MPFWNVNYEVTLNIYGENKVERFMGFCADLLGLSNLFGLKMLNATWWYIAAAHMIIVAVPIFVWIAKKGWGLFLFVFVCFFT